MRTPSQIARVIASRAALATLTGHSPVRLQNNGAYITARLAALAAAPTVHSPSETLLFVVVTTATGGAEYRPLSQFDVLPDGDAYPLYELRGSGLAAKRQFVRVRESIGAAFPDATDGGGARIGNPAREPAAAPAAAPTLATGPETAPIPAAPDGATGPDATDPESTPIAPDGATGPDGALNGTPDGADVNVNPTFFRRNPNGRKPRYVPIPAADVDSALAGGETILVRSGTGKSARYTPYDVTVYAPTAPDA